MDLRSIPTDLPPSKRCAWRRKIAEDALGVHLGLLHQEDDRIGSADEHSCEQMIGAVPVPVGLAGPLKITFSSGKTADVFLPLATTEGALVASVNRGCKALSMAGGVKTKATHHGTTRSIAFRLKIQDSKFKIQASIQETSHQWIKIAEATSEHLSVLSYDIDAKGPHLFLTLACDTDEAMGMNMVTIAAQAAGQWIAENIDGLEFITVAGNVDSDKKPSARTHQKGRGYEAIAECALPAAIIASILKTKPEAIISTAQAKLVDGSAIAGAIGKNLHAANVIAALYLATGQDAAHTVEGSLTDTIVESDRDGVRVRVRAPAILMGMRGGGTNLPVQKQCLQLLLRHDAGLHPRQQLAEIAAAAVLAGELSLLAAQATHTLAKAHEKLGR
jgi:hydroxymethylglutaryl-CoA reductase (NADPH)